MPTPISSSQQSNFWIYLFLFLSLINLTAEFYQWQLLIYLSKPLLLSSLALYFYQICRNESVYSRWILLGFIFSIFGDSFLMFVEGQARGESFFLLGLGSFLLTHLCYTTAFLRLPKHYKGEINQQPWVILVALLFLVGNLLFLWPDIPPPLRIAVALYSSVIVGMAVCCIHLKPGLEAGVFRMLLGGVLLFVLSDSIIALNKFKSAQLILPYPRLLIMLTYLSGQYWIAKASIRIHQNLNHG